MSPRYSTRYRCLQRALSAAELACKTAKSRGRRRAEIYTIDDASMMRQHGDVVAIGRLREALRGDRFMLYAQPIVALRPTDYTPDTRYFCASEMRTARSAPRAS